MSRPPWLVKPLFVYKFPTNWNDVMSLYRNKQLTNLPSQLTRNEWNDRIYPVFSFEAGYRRISPAIAIKSLAINFPSMGLVLKN